MPSSSIRNPSADQNNIHYSSRGNRPKHARRAVASHSPYGPSNESAFSRYIPNELTMHHTERKSFELPCGKTLAQSWAGLRKSWLGFKIALSNGDIHRVRHYASFIRKVQKEMGIELTEFDPDILEQETGEEVSKCASREDEATLEDDDERSADYDEMMKEAHGKLSRNCETIPVPNQMVFERRKESNRNSYKHSPQRLRDISNVKGSTITNDGRKACVHDLGNKQVKVRARSESLKNGDRKHCEYDFKYEQVKAQARSEIQTEENEDEPAYFQYSNSEEHAQVSEEMEDWQTDEDCTCNPSQYDDPSEADEKERIRTRRNSCTYEV